MVTVDPINEYLLEYSSINRWLRNFSGDTPRTYLNDFRYWFEWVRGQEGEFKDYTPDDLIVYQKEHRGYNIVDLVIDYLNEVKQGLTTNTVTRRDSVVKSFFKHNRAALPEDTYRIQGDVASTPGTLGREELKQVILASNPLYRAVFSCMYAGIMGWGELEYWSNNGYESLVEQLENRDRFIVAWQSGRKQYAGIPFYNLLGGDAVDLLRIYLENHREPGAGPIFKTQRGTPLIYDTVRYYWIRKLDKLGFIDREKGVDPGIRYGKNLHEIRDLA
ncbi:hypothetical protein GF326_01540, partial [Candidatus Bathyarchaeota archaeon]|nr:hypothetical protein [Candidatus Bathyarchaeota archaeon]